MGQTETRERILRAAAELLDENGAEALSTRAVGAAAGVQAPTLYRLFGDKDGLLDAVAAHGFQRYLAEKQAQEPTGDPVEDLRAGWDGHVRFGLGYPSFYALMYGAVRPGQRPPAADEAHGILLGQLRRVAEAGRLRVPAETAAAMILSAAGGATRHLVTRPEADRDPAFAARLRDAVISAVTTAADPAAADPAAADPAAAESGGEAGGGDLARRALALEALLDTAPDASDGGGAGSTLTPAETALLRDWLHRMAAGEAGGTR